MSYLGDALPIPQPTMDDAGWWEEAWNERLTVQQCTKCNAYRFYPTPICSECYSDEYRWAPTSGRGVVYSYVVTHHAVSPALKPYVPFNITVVELPDAGNVRMLTNILLPKGESPVIGQTVEVVWEQVAEGIKLPRFRPVED